MTLAEYLAEKDLKPSHFAEAIKVEPSTILRMLSGTRGPSLIMALRIEEATGGLVTTRDWQAIEVEPAQ